MRIVFIGTGEIGVPSLVRLANEKDFKVVAAVTQPDKPTGRHQELTPSPVKRAALSLGKPVLQPERINRSESIAEIAAFQPDVMVVCAYGQILKPKLLSLSPYGCINLHASLLPRHRGASCIASAIWQGDEISGLTTMQMDEGLDTGPILLQESVEISIHETAGSLHDKLAQLSPDLIVRTLCGLRDQTIKPRVQDEAAATYAPKLDRSVGDIDWEKSATELDRQIRALTPWPGAHTTLNKSILKILKASLIEEENQKNTSASYSHGEVVSILPAGIIVATGNGKLLLEEVQLQGRTRMPAAQFARGYRLELGIILGK